MQDSTRNTTNVKAPRLYLAGKVSKNCWRHEFVSGLRGAWSQTDYADRSVWRLTRGPMGNHHGWPILFGAIGDGAADYVGPFFVSDDHGCFHEPRWHGSYDWACGGAYANGKHGGDNYATRSDTVKQCIDAIDLADVVLAVVADDAHGTLVEIGYAAARGKTVVAVDRVRCNRHGGPEIDWSGECTEDYGEAWFPFHMRGVDSHCCAAGYIAGIVERHQSTSEESKCESPVELAFLRELRKRDHGWHRFTPNVKVMGGRYRIDFADPLTLVGVEIDGHAYHSDKETFTKDRVRQRELERSGWRLVRYSGSEVHRDAAACVEDFVAWLKAVDTEEAPARQAPQPDISTGRAVLGGRARRRYVTDDETGAS